MTSTKKIALLDCNNFFVSCERLFRPDLEGKPVVVLSSNDGCVVARSKEIKDNGIPMGVPYFQIKDKLKNLGTTCFSSNFTLYRDISRRVFSVLEEEVVELERYSIDEAFFALPSHLANQEYLLDLKCFIEKRVGIPVSIGAADTKTIAKYANSIGKKGSGAVLLDCNDWLKEAKQVPIYDIWGVGKGMELRFKQAGITTAKDLIGADTSLVKRLFNLPGLRLRSELSGQPVRAVAGRRSAKKSLISSRSFSKATNDIRVLEDAVAYHLRKTLADLRKSDLLAGSISVFIKPSRHGDFVLRGGQIEEILATPTSDTVALSKVANQLLHKLFEAGVPYNKAGVSLARFDSVDSEQQLDIFNTKSVVTKNKLMDTLDSLNHKADRELVVVGSRLATNQWQSKSGSRSPSYTTKWTDIASVKAS